MQSEVTSEFVEVPRPIAILLETAYIVLLAIGSLASIITTGCLLWKFLGNGCSISPSFLSAQVISDTKKHKDEESGEECPGLEFENDTDEEYLRRPY